MLSLPHLQKSENAIHLTDDLFERADTVKAFLDLVSCEKDRLPFAGSYAEWAQDLVALIQFMDKYDSHNGLELLRAYGAEMVLVKRAFCPIDAFVFGALSNDLALCIAALELSSGWTWTGPSSRRSEIQRVLSSIDDKPLFDLEAVPFSFTASLPAPYLWALSRASGEADLEEHPNTFCREFQRCVEMALKKLEQGGLIRP